MRKTALQQFLYLVNFIICLFYSAFQCYFCTDYLIGRVSRPPKSWRLSICKSCTSDHAKKQPPQQYHTVLLTYMCVLVLYLVHIKLIPIRVRLHRVSMLASMCVFCSALSISKQVLGATLTVVLYSTHLHSISLVLSCRQRCHLMWPSLLFVCFLFFIKKG